MSAAWLLYALVVGTAMALAGHAAESLCRQLRLPARWAWGAAMAICLVLVLLPTRPDRNDGVDANGLVTRASPTSVVAAANGNPFLSAVARTVALTGTVTRELIAGAVRRLPIWVSSGAALLVVLTALAALVTLLLVHLRLRRARRDWPAAELHGTPVRIAPSMGPAVIGLLRPEIVVPRWLLGRSEEEQRLVMEHEREHLRRGDHLLLGAASVAVALVPWHPAVWWMLARLRLAIELDCDARVLRRGVTARTYGTLLIDLAGQCSGFRVGATALADEGSHLERRLLAMNDKPAKSSVVRVTALGAATALLLLAACESTMPTSAEIQSMDVASAERSVSGVKLMKHTADNTIFFVDGKRTDARTAHALTPNQISTINVVGPATESEPVTIRIATTGEPAAKGEEGHIGMMRRFHSMLGQPAPEGSQQLKIRTPAPDSKLTTGIIFVDGVRADAAALRQLDPRTFQSVEVIKAPEAWKLYGDPAAKNGVIRITTRR